jgi:hypothetical protein
MTEGAWIELDAGVMDVNAGAGAAAGAARPETAYDYPRKRVETEPSVEVVRGDPDPNPDAESRHQQQKNEGVEYLPPLPADLRDTPSAPALLRIEPGHTPPPLRAGTGSSPVPTQTQLERFHY